MAGETFATTIKTATVLLMTWTIALLCITQDKKTLTVSVYVFHFFISLFLDNGWGDQCDDDHDGDGTNNLLDNCPNNSRVSVTDFNNIQEIALDPHGTSQRDSEWVILNEGAEILQTQNSDPGLAIGQDKIGGVDFEGTFFVNTQRDDDYVGFVFSYQSNSKFYVVMWKKWKQMYWKTQPFTAIAKEGIQLKLVDSIDGPGTWLRNAMWHTGNTRDQVKLLWEDPKQQGWESKVRKIL